MRWFFRYTDKRFNVNCLVLKNLQITCISTLHCRNQKLYIKGHQPFWKCELLLLYRLIRRAISLIHIFEIKILLNLLSIILVLIFVNVKALIMLILFLEQAHGRPTWSLQATWCPRTPCWWPLGYSYSRTIACFVYLTSN